METTVTRWLSAKDVWTRLGISKSSFYRGVNNGRYPKADLVKEVPDKNGNIKEWKRWSLESILLWESTKKIEVA